MGRYLAGTLLLLLGLGCSKAWIPAAFEKPSAGIQACYRASSLGLAEVPVKLKFGVTVGTTGKATEVGIVELSHGNTELERCVLQTLLDQHYGFRYAGLCYVTAVRLEGDVAEYGTAKIGEPWCKNPYILPQQAAASSSVD